MQKKNKKNYTLIWESPTIKIINSKCYDFIIVDVYEYYEMKYGLMLMTSEYWGRSYTSYKGNTIYPDRDTDIMYIIGIDVSH